MNDIKEVSQARTREYNPKQTIFTEDEKFDYMYMLSNGVVKLTKTTSEGRTQVIGFRFSGDLLPSTLSSENYDVGAEAINKTEIIFCPMSSFNDEVDKNGGLQEWYKVKTQMDLKNYQDQIITLGRPLAQQRLARFFLWLKEKQGTETVSIPMSQSDIAEYLGLTPETVCRVMKKLEKSGSITKSARDIIIDEKALQEIIEL